MTELPVQRLRRGDVFAYALPAAAMALPTLPVYVLLPAFYVEHTALGLATVGLVLFLARLLDAGSDLLAGRICDHPLGRLGRRRGWMLIGGLILAPGLIGLFNPPDNAGVAWLLGFALLLYLGWTLVQVPYLAWGADLSGDYRERLRLTGHREGLGLIGLVLSAAWPATAVWLGFGDRQAFGGLALATLLLGTLAFVWAWRRLPEPRPKISARGDWRQIRRNGPWRLLMLAWLLNAIANGVAAVLFPFFVTEVLGLDESRRGQFLLAYFLAAVLAMPLLMAAGRHVSKHRLWAASMLFACSVFALVPWIGPGDSLGFLLVCLATGLALGADLALPPALLADTVDWDRLRNRSERPALFFAGASFVSKLALGLAVAIGPALLALFGWQDQGPQPAVATTALVVIYAGVPCVLKLTTVALIWRFPLDERRHRRIRHRLDRQQAETTA